MSEEWDINPWGSARGSFSGCRPTAPPYIPSLYNNYKDGKSTDTVGANVFTDVSQCAAHSKQNACWGSLDNITQAENPH